MMLTTKGCLMTPYSRTFLIIFIVLIFPFQGLATAQTVSVGILNNSGAQRTFYTNFAKQFERDNPGIKVKLEFKSDAEFKEALTQWFENGDGPDVLNWQGGERLFQYVKQGKVAPITELWTQHSMSQQFTAGARGAVTLNNNVYAVPISYYQWGFYYRQSVFDKLHLAVPATWDEFLHLCDTLADHGIVPITVGAKYKWPTAAWFDYLNLRINGLTFHQDLLKGNVSFLDERVASVLEKWKYLLDKGYFVQQYDRWAWGEAMPFLYHKMAGMTLIGNFFISSMPVSIKDDFRFFPFPQIDEQVEFFEEAPLDVFMLPSYAEDNSAAKRFLHAVAQKEFQHAFNEKMGMIAPNNQVPLVDDYFIEQGQKLLTRAAGVSQFFDRDTSAEMSSAAMEIFTQFMEHKDVRRAQVDLEEARQRLLL